MNSIYLERIRAITLDLALLLECFGEGFVRRVISTYPAAQMHMRRARFYAQAIELEWVRLGLETKEIFWFTAHIGGARDLFEARA